MVRVEEHVRPTPVVRTRPFCAFSYTHDFSDFRDSNMSTSFRQSSCIGYKQSKLHTDNLFSIYPARIHEILTGVYDRETYAVPAAKTLSSLCESIQTKGLRNRFRALFRYDDVWLVDSIEWVLARDNALRREINRTPEFAVSLPVSESTNKNARLYTPLHLGYLLYQARGNDPQIYAKYEEKARSINENCYRVAVQVCSMLEEAEAWYFEVLNFFLFEPWLSLGNGREGSLLDLLTETFPNADSVGEFSLSVEPCGMPDAYASESCADQLLEKVIEGVNREGNTLLLKMDVSSIGKRLLEADMRLKAHLGYAEGKYRIMDWYEVLEGGMIQKKQKLRFDIGNPIINLIELTLHELTHLAYARMRPSINCINSEQQGSSILLRYIDRTLEEGIAEFFTDQALSSLYRNFPLLDTYRTLRLSILQTRPNDPHLYGYALLKEYYEKGRFSNAYDFLESVATANYKLTDLLSVWGETKLPNVEIDETVAIVPAMEIEAGAQWTVRTFEFNKVWVDIAFRYVGGFSHF